MTDVTSLSAEELLKRRALDLFDSEREAGTVYRELARLWHPDVSRHPRAAEVLSHVNARFQEAKRAWAAGGAPNTLTLKTSTGSAAYPYLAVRQFELGELYVCERHLVWASRREHDELARRALETLRGLSYPDDDVRAKVRPYLPRNAHTIGSGDRAYTIMDRPGDFVRVADVVARGPMDPRHVAWTVSRAYKLAGYLQYAGLRHLDISPETFFIEPATHHGALLGGWYYTGVGTRGNARPRAAPARTAHLARSSANLDAQVRLLGRRALGAALPSQLRARADVKEPLKSWLLGAGLEDVWDAEKRWFKVLVDTFGERRFTEYALTTAEVYPNH